MTNAPTTEAPANRAAHKFVFEDPYSRFVVEALLLRTLHRYADAARRAKDYGVDLSALPKAPDFEEISARYTKLMDEMVSDGPSDAGGLKEYTDLAAIIVADGPVSPFGGDCRIVSSERDAGYALELLACVHRQLSGMAIEEVLAVERAARAKGVTA